MGEAKAKANIKYKKYYHVALSVSEGQCEGPTMTLSQISTVVKDLQTTVATKSKVRNY